MVSAYDQERKGFWHEPDGQSTSEAIALEAWAQAADEALRETAGSYHAVLREADLVRRVQTDTGVHTTRTPDRWLRKLLGPLALDHARAGDPPLTALVVDVHGWVGERYEDILLATEQRAIADRDDRERHAARSRLECYRWAGAVPEDGGVPAAVPRAVGGRTPRPARERAPRASSGSTGSTGSMATAGSRAARPAREKAPVAPRRVAASDRPIAVCPRCFMAIPATGVCDNCD